MLLCRCEGKNPIACSCNSIRHNEATTTTIAQCIWYWRIGREKRIVDMYRSARRAWQSTILCSPLEHEEIATMTTAKQWKIYYIYIYIVWAKSQWLCVASDFCFPLIPVAILHFLQTFRFVVQLTSPGFEMKIAWWKLRHISNGSYLIFWWIQKTYFCIVESFWVGVGRALARSHLNWSFECESKQSDPFPNDKFLLYCRWCVNVCRNLFPINEQIVDA